MSNMNYFTEFCIKVLLIEVVTILEWFNWFDVSHQPMKWDKTHEKKEQLCFHLPICPFVRYYIEMKE